MLSTRAAVPTGVTTFCQLPDVWYNDDNDNDDGDGGGGGWDNDFASHRYHVEISLDNCTHLNHVDGNWRWRRLMNAIDRSMGDAVDDTNGTRHTVGEEIRGGNVNDDDDDDAAAANGGHSAINCQCRYRWGAHTARMGEGDDVLDDIDYYYSRERNRNVWAPPLVNPMRARLARLLFTVPPGQSWKTAMVAPGGAGAGERSLTFEYTGEGALPYYAHCNAWRFNLTEATREELLRGSADPGVATKLGLRLYRFMSGPQEKDYAGGMLPPEHVWYLFVLSRT